MDIERVEKKAKALLRDRGPSPVFSQNTVLGLIRKIRSVEKERDRALEKLEALTAERESLIDSAFRASEAHVVTMGKLREMESQKPVAYRYKYEVGGALQKGFKYKEEPSLIGLTEEPLYAKPVPAERPASRPSPCEHLCESKAYEIEIRQLKRQISDLEALVIERGEQLDEH